MKVTDIDNILPQTQCTKCGYDDCISYASAIFRGTPHNQCPPGGQLGIDKLSFLLNRDSLSLNSSNGIEAAKTLAVINEDLCIGCEKCILACPVDAIIGAKQQMHTVIADICTGCDLCIAPCPMDCIDMIHDSKLKNMSKDDEISQQNFYRENHNNKIERIKLSKQKQNDIYANNKNKNGDISNKKDYIKQALELSRKKKLKIYK